MGKGKNEARDLNPSAVASAFQGVFDLILADLAQHPEKYQHLQERKVGNPITLGPRVISAADWAKKQIERAQGAASTWAANVLAPRKDPVEAAIRADKKRKDKLDAAEKAGKWLAKMKKVDKDEMVETIKAVGSSGYSAGIGARTRKISRVVGELQPMTAALADAIDKLPEETDAQREARLLAARKGMIAIGLARAK